ncbi:Sugar tr and/or MFS 1 domain containing protein, partial [Asbolus verrucosus]
KSDRQLLPTSDSSTSSACATSTNLSSWDFQSDSTINKIPMKGTMLKDDLRITVPEMEPLKKKSEMNVTEGKQEFPSSVEQLYYKDTQKIWPQLIAAIAVSWVSLVVGYTSGYTSPAGTSLRRDMNLTDRQYRWISGSMTTSALMGSLVGGPLIEYVGRKWTLLISNMLFLIGWIVNYYAQEYWCIFVSKWTVGYGVGIATLTIPVYLGETLQPKVRGTLGLLPTAFGNIGILICFCMGNLFEWREIAGIGALLSLPFLIPIWIIPETAHWYVSKGKSNESRETLEWLMGKTNQNAINKEHQELLKRRETSNEKTAISDIFTKTNLKPFMIILGLMFFQQMSGINAVIFHTTQIFNDTGSNIESSIQTTIVGVVNFISTFIATIFIDRLGRKALLYISSVAMIVTLGILGTYFYLVNVTHVNVSTYSWIPLASFIIYVLGFSFGFGPVPWLMMGEILPTKIRGTAASFSTAFNWMCTAIITTAFPPLRDFIGSHGVFWFFCFMTILALVFTIVSVPETKGQSLEDIERELGSKNSAGSRK